MTPGVFMTELALLAGAAFVALYLAWPRHRARPPIIVTNEVFRRYAIDPKRGFEG